MLQTKQTLNIVFSLLLFCGVLMTGCVTVSDNSSQNRVTLQFQTTISQSGATSSAAFGQQADDTLIVEGSNGRMEIEDIRFIVEKIKLKKDKDDVECDDEENGK